MADGGNLVTIRDIDVPFWRIVLILIKWSIAAIPAVMMEMFGVPIPEVPTPPTP